MNNDIMCDKLIEHLAQSRICFMSGGVSGLVCLGRINDTILRVNPKHRLILKLWKLI